MGEVRFDWLLWSAFTGRGNRDGGTMVTVECIYCLLSGRGRVSLVIVECIYCRHVDGYCGILALTLSGTSRISLVNMECIYWKGKRDEGYTGNCGIRLLPPCGRLRDTIRIK